MDLKSQVKVCIFDQDGRAWTGGLLERAFDCIGAEAAGMRSALTDRRGWPFRPTPYRSDVIAPHTTHGADIMA